MDYVRVCGMRRFQRGLDEITKAIADRGILADLWARDLVKLQAKERQDLENARAIKAKHRQLDDETEAVADLEALYNDVTKLWSNIKLHRNIGHVQYAAAISVDVEGGTLYTSDWAAFLAAEVKVMDEFEGNVVDLGSKYDPQDLTDMFCPLGGGPTTFKFPDERKLRIEGCATKEDLAHPAEFNSEGQRCLMVGKDGNTTDLTVGRYAGLVSFTQNQVGIESVELGIYNSGDKTAQVFSAKGDSGSLVWHMMNGKARIVANSTLDTTRAARPAMMLRTAPLAGISWVRSRRGSSTPTSTVPPGQLENSINGSSFSSVSCFRTHSWRTSKPASSSATSSPPLCSLSLVLIRPYNFSNRDST
ncbi:hypothetical protein F5146DRAFT_1040678 [Armillaria mellea]|nr:hypothetical protein F5146DRAFT_1040678 [Armillaria mellea]